MFRLMHLYMLQPDFIWDNAIKHGKSARIYGEASVPVFDNKLKWTDIYKKYKNGEKVEFTNHTTIEPVKKISEPDISFIWQS